MLKNLEKIKKSSESFKKTQQKPKFHASPKQKFKKKNRQKTLKISKYL